MYHVSAPRRDTAIGGDAPRRAIQTGMASEHPRVLIERRLCFDFDSLACALMLIALMRSLTSEASCTSCTSRARALSSAWICSSASRCESCPLCSHCLQTARVLEHLNACSPCPHCLHCTSACIQVASVECDRPLVEAARDSGRACVRRPRSVAASAALVKELHAVLKRGCGLQGGADRIEEREAAAHEHERTLRHRTHARARDAAAHAQRGIRAPA